MSKCSRGVKAPQFVDASGARLRAPDTTTIGCVNPSGDCHDTVTHELRDQADRETASLVTVQAVPGFFAARPAVFLDRDGTLMENVPYLSDPKLVRLLPGAAETLKRLRLAGFARILVTNQSAIGRGILTEERLNQIHAELIRQLAAQGATIDAIYYCPSVPRGDDRTVIEDFDRKPGPGMLFSLPPIRIWT